MQVLLRSRVELITAIALIAAPFVLPLLGFALALALPAWVYRQRQELSVR